MYPKKEELKREIGVWGLSSNLINIMVGAGIFVLPAIIYEGLGQASIIAYLFCGLLIGMIMLCFAELGSKITCSGGAYAYIEAAFGKYFGFLTTMLFVCASISADAAVGNALIDVLGTSFPVFKNVWIKPLLFFILFMGLAYVNITGVKQGIVLVKTITAVKLIPLILLIAIGSPEITMANFVFETTPSISQIGQMSLILFFAFQGGEIGLTISGEVKNPQKTIPRSIFIAISIVLILYIAIQVVSQGVLGNVLSNFKEAPLAQVSLKLFGSIGFSLMIFGAALSMFGNLSGEILSVPRIIYGAAKGKVIPLKFLSAVHSKYRTPYIAIIIYAGLGFIGSVIGGFKQLAILSSTSTLLIYLGVALAVIKLRKSKRSKTFKIPFGYFIPLSAIITIAWLLSNLSIDEYIGIIIFLSLFSVIYLIIYISYYNRNTKLKDWKKNLKLKN